MLRTERALQLLSSGLSDAPHTLARDLLIAVAPPPRTHVYDLSGWPNWLAPSYRSGGLRTASSRPRESEK